ncbi:MAG: O-methyltransferase [Stackebrandtia sp.]
MSRASIAVDEELHDYMVAHGTPPDAVMRDLAEETLRMLPKQAGMQIAPEQSAFLTFLARIVGVRHGVEIGTFTGMSALSIARGMADDGRLVCFDVSEEYTSVARRYWERDGKADKIELRIGDAKEELKALPSEPHVDMAFIDADKTGYLTYWEELMPRMRPGGVVVVDNVFQGGRVVDRKDHAENVVAIREFNEQVASDVRVDVSMIPVADGLTLARKR